MAQVTFSGSSGTIPNLNQNFTQLYDLRELISTPGYTAATPKLTIDALGALTAGNLGTGGEVLLKARYTGNTIASFATEYGNGGPIMEYGVFPSTSASTAFISSTAANSERSAIVLVGGQLVYSNADALVVAVGSPVTLTERFRVNTAGNTTFAPPTSGTNLTATAVAGALAASFAAGPTKLQSTTVAALLSAATAGAGARANVSDATVTTFASVVAGGGANAVPVYSDGTQWKIG